MICFQFFFCVSLHQVTLKRSEPFTCTFHLYTHSGAHAAFRWDVHGGQSNFNPHFILGEVTQRSRCGITAGLSHHDAPTPPFFIYLPVWPWRVLRVIFILYLRRLAHTYGRERSRVCECVCGGEGGSLMECLCLLMAFQINTRQLCSPAWETESTTVALTGWSPLMKSLLDSIDRFILALSPRSVHVFPDPLSHCKVIDTKLALKSSRLLWYDLAQ